MIPLRDKKEKADAFAFETEKAALCLFGGTPLSHLF